MVLVAADYVAHMVATAPDGFSLSWRLAMKKKVYVAGAYSQGDVMENIRKAIEAGDWLLELGHTPFIPHLTGFWHFYRPHSYEAWMKYDESWLRSCDAIFRLPGNSKGADREVKIARSLGMPVYYQWVEVPEAENG